MKYSKQINTGFAKRQYVDEIRDITKQYSEENKVYTEIKKFLKDEIKNTAYSGNNVCEISLLAIKNNVSFASKCYIINNLEVIDAVIKNFLVQEGFSVSVRNKEESPGATKLYKISW
jgi:hypothetical protein